ncbi:UDP-N-acetylglucosamine transferase subunit [Savitreella phatthalungensis]
MMTHMGLSAFFIGPLISFLLIIATIYTFIILSSRASQAKINHKHDTPTLVVVLGSGGHTAEMMRMLHTMDLAKFNRRLYYITSGDGLSAERANRLESGLAGKGKYDIFVLPRARMVKQSWLSTPFTTCQSAIACLRRISQDKPDLVVCNGPGTCVPIVLAARLLDWLQIKQSRIIFFESFARVDTLSLTGKIFARAGSLLVDRFVVRWHTLKQSQNLPHAQVIQL